MIKKSLFAEELATSMHKQLVKQATHKEYNNLEKAADYLNSAAEIFEDIGMIKCADGVLSILEKIANDRHTKGLTSDKMVSNLKHHGTMFNLTDDKNLLDSSVKDTLEVSDNITEKELDDFEDEID